MDHTTYRTLQVGQNLRINFVLVQKLDSKHHRDYKKVCVTFDKEVRISARKKSENETVCFVTTPSEKLATFNKKKKQNVFMYLNREENAPKSP